MGDLKWLETGFETAFGRIEVSLRRRGRRIDATLTVPEGTTCIVPDARLRSSKTLGPGTHELRIN